MDGQIIYIQSSSAPDAVRGCDKSPGGWGSGGGGSGSGRGGEPNGAEQRERGDEEDTASGGENTGKEKNKECSRASREGGRGEEAVYSVRIEP